MLKVHPRGLFALCPCGLYEWLWSPEDDYEVLVENVERLGVPLWKAQAAVEGFGGIKPSKRVGVEAGLASERVTGRPQPGVLGEEVHGVPAVFLGRLAHPELVEDVISHETVHIAIDRLLGSGRFLDPYLKAAHHLWDFESKNSKTLFEGGKGRKRHPSEDGLKKGKGKQSRQISA